MTTDEREALIARLEQMSNRLHSYARMHGAAKVGGHDTRPWSECRDCAPDREAIAALRGEQP